MASVLSHPAVPLAIAIALGPTRVPPGLTVAACVASALPDIDSIGFFAGIPYGHPLGHRGFTHSLFFASLAGGIGALFSRTLHTSALVAFAVIFASTASHGVLDAMSTGGLGVAFFAPFSNARYFLPWRVIVVSPIGIRSFFSSWGIAVVRSELLWVWLPCVLLGTAGAAVRIASR